MLFLKNNDESDPTIMVQRPGCYYLLVDYIIHNQPTSTDTHKRELIKIQWQLPPPGAVKLNFDGAVFESLKAIGIGVIIYDQASKVGAAISRKESMCGNAEEIKAVRRAIGLADDMGITRLILEGDSINVPKAIHRVDENLSGLVHLVEEIQTKPLNFECWEVKYETREGNQGADKIEKDNNVCETVSV